MKITSDCGAENKLICFKGIDLISEQFCWFWYAVCHRNIVAVIMTMRAITYQWSRNFVSFSSFLLVVAIDKLYRDTKKISTNSQLYNPNLSALIISSGRKLELCAIFLWHIFVSVSFYVQLQVSLSRNYLNDFNKDGELKAKLGCRNFPTSFLKIGALSLKFCLVSFCFCIFAFVKHFFDVMI